jgi:ubiquinone/menaquinone biosynthesis C-methylase UbiE
MGKKDERQDKRFARFAHDNPFRRLFWPPRRLLKPYASEGQVVADLGCGPGFYAITLAELVGPSGKVHAVDLDEYAVGPLEQKMWKRGLGNIDVRVASASELGFIKDASVDFVLAHGLLCSMAPRKRDAAVREIKRILKPGARAYLSVALGPWSNIDRKSWETILSGFEVERKGGGLFGSWAAVTAK